MPVSKPNNEYADKVGKWELVADCVEGEDKIKKGREKYLPKPNSTDKSSENDARYNAYLQRASFENVTARTKNTMLGAAFRKKAVTDLPNKIEYIIENATIDNTPLLNVLKKTVGEVLEKGRFGILVEYKSAAPGLSVADVEAQGLRAYFAPYVAEDIINWRVTGGKLTMVVLKESTSTDDDGFTKTTENQYRVLSLVAGVYIQQLYDKADNPVGEPTIPLKSNGETWDEIPFVFIGAQDNDAKIDNAPLYDMAIVNVAHFRNSADHEESLFLVGQPTPVLTGLNQNWVDTNMKDGLHIGSRAVISLPEGGAATLLQAGANSMPLEGMKHKEKQMVALGARLIESGGQAETAETARIKHTADNSVLSSVVGNVQAGIGEALRWAAVYMGIPGDKITLTMNRDFFEQGFDAQMLTGLVNVIDRRVISTPVAREYLRKTGLIAEGKTDEEIDAEIEKTNPIGGLGGDV